MNQERASELSQDIINEVAKVISGQDGAIRQMTAALIAGGHALLEGVPGTAKTLMARLLAKTTAARFGRIQFTPDMMPSDVVGVNIYNTCSGQFVFRRGPVFCDILLADEINRAPAKTQSALLEAMQEKQATVDGTAYGMSNTFTVFATQNPVEFEGTYPLPEAEVDRFMLKILVNYPDETAEAAILDGAHDGMDASVPESLPVKAVADSSELLELRQAVRAVHVEQKVRRYISGIVRATRTMPQVMLGASPRAGVMLMLASQACAVLEGRSFVTPDDVKAMALPALRHRMILQSEVEIEGRTADDCINQLLRGMEVPR